MLSSRKRRKAEIFSQKTERHVDIENIGNYLMQRHKREDIIMNHDGISKWFRERMPSASKHPEYLI